MNRLNSSSQRIKANRALLVKAVLLLYAFSSAAWAQPSGDDSHPEDTAASRPEIEARSFDVQITGRSTSKRTYMFSDLQQAHPRVGRILLLKQGPEPIMAFRILKVYPAKNEFAAKRVHRYGPHQILNPGDAFSALEKLADIAPPPPPTAEENRDLKELENGSASPPGPPVPAVQGAQLPTNPAEPPPAPADAAGAPQVAASPTPQPTATPSPAPSPYPEAPDTKDYDSELDAGSSPPPHGGVDSDPDEMSDEDAAKLASEDVVPMERTRSALSVEFGFLKNNGTNLGDGTGYYKAGGLRYGLTLGRMLFVRKPTLQDTLVIEAGGFFYQDIGSNSDSYTIISGVGTLRYNILLNENYGIFFYGGMMSNRVLSASNPNATALNQLTSFLPAAGGGLLLHVGPNWDVRVDLGTDMIATGLMLRF